MASAPLLDLDELVKRILKTRLNVKRVRPGLIEAWMIVEDKQWKNQVIKPTDKVFIPAREIHLKTHLHRELLDYAAIFKGYHNFVEKKCDLIIGWQEDFIDDSLEFRKAQLAEAQRRRQSSKHKDPLVVKFMPGADPTNYHTTEASPHRLYHAAQSIPKELKNVYYEGHSDVDVENCFSNIAANEFRKHGLLNDELEHFLTSSRTLESLQGVQCNGLTPKQLRLRAIHGSDTGKLRSTGDAYYDEKCEELRSNWKQLKVSNVHVFLTEAEQQIMDRVIGVCGPQNVTLRMHDGLIMQPGVDAEDVVERAQDITGYAMKWKRLGSC